MGRFNYGMCQARDKFVSNVSKKISGGKRKIQSNFLNFPPSPLIFYVLLSRNNLRGVSMKEGFAISSLWQTRAGQIAR